VVAANMIFMKGVDSDDGDPVFWDVDPPAKQVNV